MDAGQDSAHVVSLSPPPIHKHPHLRHRSRDRNTAESDDKEVFAWRKVGGNIDKVVATTLRHMKALYDKLRHTHEGTLESSRQI